MGTEGEDDYERLTDALTPVKTVGKLRQVIREEMASNCISKSEVRAMARQIAKEETESSQEMMVDGIQNEPSLAREC